MTLKIIGAGLGRTGTKSLKVALEKLGFAPCYHMVEMLMNPAGPKLWCDAFDGKPDWNAIYQGYAASLDTPTCFYYRELAAFYPDAKFILTVRDVEKWIPSFQGLLGLRAPPEVREAALKGMPPDTVAFYQKRFAKQFGHLPPAEYGRPEFLRAHFAEHLADVERAIPQQRLLKYEVAQGWAPLCNFLGVPVPDEPFPRVVENRGAPVPASAPGEIGWEEWIAMLNARRTELGVAPISDMTPVSEAWKRASEAFERKASPKS